MVELGRFEDAVSERMAQLELEDLERYQRDVDSQRRIVRMRRPIQRFEMRVPDYYRRFCYWKEDMISVGYPDDESIYIDDFIGNLQWHIQLRVSNHISRISKLVDAYFEAKYEETTILLEGMMKDLKVANEINEMDDRFPTEIQEDGDSDGSGNCDAQHPDEEIQSDSAIKSAEDGNHFTAKLLPENLYGKKVSLYSFPYIYESGSSVNGSSGISGLITDISKVSTPNLNYGDDVLGVSEHNSPSLPRLGFNPQVFDPGTLALFKLHCINSGIFLVYLHEYDEFSVYFHLVIGLWGYLFEWTGSRDSQIDWVLSIWNRIQAFFLHCSVLLWNYNIIGVDNSIRRNSTSTVTHVVWSNRPFANFHVGALAQICTAFDQSVPKITNGHYMGNGSSNVYVIFVGFLIQRLLFEFYGRLILDIVKHQLYTLPVNNFGYQNDGLQKVTHQNNLFWERLKPTQTWAGRNSNNELLVVGFTFNNLTLIDSGGDRIYALRYCYIGGVVPPLFGKAQRTGVKALTEVVLLLRHVHSKLLSNFLYCWSLFLEGLTNVLDLVTSFSSRISLVSPLRADFAWDPGICAIFDYILEDKDVFKRVGKWITVMDHITELTITMPWFMNNGEDHIGLQQAGDVAFAVARPFQLGTSMKGSDTIKNYSVKMYQGLNASGDFIWLALTQHWPVPRICSFMVSHLWAGYTKRKGECIKENARKQGNSYIHITLLALSNTVICCNFGHLGRCILIPGIHINFEEFNDSLHVVFSICPEDEQDGKYCITLLMSNDVIWARIAGISKKAKGVQNNFNIMEWCVMASMHYLDRINGMDGNVVAFTYHSSEIYLTGVVNMKGFVWDPGRVLYGIRIRYKVESLVAIGRYFDTTSILMEVTTSTIFSFVTKVVGCADSSLELGGVLLIVLCEKKCRQWYDLLPAFSSTTCSQWLFISEDTTSGHVRNCMSQSGAYDIIGAFMSKICVWDPGVFLISPP